MENKELIEYYAAQKIEGRYLSEIRKELLQKGFTEVEASSLISKIDEQVLLHELSKTNAKINKQILYFGVFLLSLGVIMFILGRTGTFVIRQYLVISSVLLLIALIMVIYSLIFSQRSRRRRR